ncbi:hypothetical protein [Glycomyces harbinensis]|uniref:Uncharacterized protein n=1 Tax=Glycomyces harbinensis TaxID=58114 RepID=A0A1G6YUD9_9ACTN|nr:hypothetical protein [Glycomyces harbinensis]SDD93968.1 hypothetical protein SAMN05216270_109178 [Glycomyces harbinensis]
MKNDYYVSYSRIADHGGNFGFGYAIFTLTRPLTGDVVKEMHDYLNGENPGNNIIILSFQRLESPQAQTSSV